MVAVQIVLISFWFTFLVNFRFSSCEDSVMYVNKLADKKNVIPSPRWLAEYIAFSFITTDCQPYIIPVCKCATKTRVFVLRHLPHMPESCWTEVVELRKTHRKCMAFDESVCLIDKAVPEEEEKADYIRFVGVGLMLFLFVCLFVCVVIVWLRSGLPADLISDNGASTTVIPDATVQVPPCTLTKEEKKLLKVNEQAPETKSESFAKATAKQEHSAGESQKTKTIEKQKPVKV